MAKGLRRLSLLLRAEEGIDRGPFSRYFLLSMVAMTFLSLGALMTGDAVLFDSMLQIQIFGSMALSYDYFSGYLRYYNLGYGAFIASGAYVFTIVSNSGLNIVLAILLAGVLTSIFAGVICYPFLRLRGAYFAIASLVLVLLLRVVDINLFQYTGGTAGIHVNASGRGIGTPLFLASLSFLLVTLAFHYLIGKSRLGLAMRSIREDEDAARSIGINTFRVKQLAMMLSGFFGGIAASWYSLYLGFINADNVLGLTSGLFPITAAITGGSGIFLGPLIGSFAVVGVNLLLPSVISEVYPTSVLGPQGVTGILLVLVGMFAPGGLLTFRFFQRFASSRPDMIGSLVRNRRTSLRKMPQQYLK